MKASETIFNRVLFGFLMLSLFLPYFEEVRGYEFLMSQPYFAFSLLGFFATLLFQAYLRENAYDKKLAFLFSLFLFGSYSLLFFLGARLDDTVWFCRLWFFLAFGLILTLVIKNFVSLFRRGFSKAPFFGYLEGVGGFMLLTVWILMLPMFDGGGLVPNYSSFEMIFTHLPFVIVLFFMMGYLYYLEFRSKKKCYSGIYFWCYFALLLALLFSGAQVYTDAWFFNEKLANFSLGFEQIFKKKLLGFYLSQICALFGMGLSFYYWRRFKTRD